ncbi:phage tail tube protein [Chakrabartyella piscis]|uniref:phage tail tube protein n=1 Tax=Chakrabartyella piscis TaxID=2918914 RepID=UPI002958A69D|nr:phage tail tube protein [Chakrabartyella piscis]
MAYLRAKDTVNGALGTCYAIIDDNRYELMQVKNVSATVTKNKTEIPILGMTGLQYKSGGWTGSGTMTVYYVSSLFRELMLDYMKNGVDTYFELMITNEDPTGDCGTQTVLLKDVNINELLMTKLDVEADALDEDLKFTFGDVDLLDTFTDLT